MQLISRRGALTILPATALSVAADPFLARADSTPSRAREIGWRHNVLFNYKDDVHPDQRDRINAFMLSLLLMPQIKGAFLGKNLLPANSPRWFEWQFIVDFDSEAASVPFFKSAEHDDLAHLWGPRHTEVVVVNQTRRAANIASAPGVKFRHSLFYNYDQQVSEPDRARAQAELEAVLKGPHVSRYVLGRGDPANGQKPRYEWVMTADFADRKAFEAYRQRKEHMDFARRWGPMRTDIAIFDTAV